MPTTTTQLTQTDHIKSHLERKGLDYPASQVVDDLAAKGIETTRELVYQVRSILKRNQEDLRRVNRGKSNGVPNDRPLSEHILQALAQVAQPVDANTLARRVLAGGFKTNSEVFIATVRTQCQRLIDLGKVVRHATADRKVTFSLPDKGTNNVNVEQEEATTAAAAPPKQQEEEPQPAAAVHHSISVGINSDDLTNLVKVQRLLREVGGAEKMNSYLQTLAVLAKTPATEMLEMMSPK